MTIEWEKLERGCRTVQFEPFYRSALNAEWAATLHDGALFQASREIYPLLYPVELPAGGDVAHLAQRLTAATRQKP
jgi:hypothetical protein